MKVMVSYDVDGGKEAVIMDADSVDQALSRVIPDVTKRFPKAAHFRAIPTDRKAPEENIKDLVEMFAEAEERYQKESKGGKEPSRGAKRMYSVRRNKLIRACGSWDTAKEKIKELKAH